MSDLSGKPGLFWKLQGLLRRKAAESVRDRVEELIERGEDHRDTTELDESDLDTHERALLSNVLRLQGTAACDVMVPRADIMAMSEDLTLEEAISLIQKDGHSRFPVYRESLDDIAGMVHIKDVFASVGSEKPFDIKAILRKPLFVVPSIPVLDLLLQMRLARIHMALVVDEYGGIDGLVTIEDLVEEIIGEIEDEHDVVKGPHLVQRPDGTLLADARTTIETFEEKVGPVLTEEERDADIDTLGGLVMSLTDRVPLRGELVTHSSGITFEVLDADPRRIKRLRVRNIPDPTKAAEPATKD